MTWYFNKKIMHTLNSSPQRSLKTTEKNQLFDYKYEQTHAIDFAFKFGKPYL